MDAAGLIARLRGGAQASCWVVRFDGDLIVLERLDEVIALVGRSFPAIGRVDVVDRDVLRTIYVRRAEMQPTPRSVS